MARIDGQTLFVTTSPRSPMRMIPEIELLSKNFTGKKWDKKCQIAFMGLLRSEDFFHGKGEKDPAFSARDRINRAPKSLGFVALSPTIRLTSAGHELLNSRRKDEVFLRQLLKFQLPSPFHRPTENAAHFCIKPYLEFLRIIRFLGTLRFDELQLFAMQLTDWHEFDKIIAKIKRYRSEMAMTELSQKQFWSEYQKRELSYVFAARIRSGRTKTRESGNTTLHQFLKTEGSNLRDYADAAVRYLQVTGLVNVSHRGRTLSIVPERFDDVDYILKNVERDPGNFESETDYIAYLETSTIPKLLTDRRESLIKKLNDEFPGVKKGDCANVEKLKDILSDAIEARKRKVLSEQIAQVKNYRFYDDIQNVFTQIEKKELYDTPLMFEWNTWRAMMMLDGGNIQANLNFDDYGKPLSTAPGNLADIVCDYGDFCLSVEVTLATGQRQYDMEGEPVSRHLGKLKKETGKTAYCLFIAPNINDACIAHFYGLHHLNISYYGGKSSIVPLPLAVFRKMLEDSHRCSYAPSPKQIQRFFETSDELAVKFKDERGWYSAITERALNWLD